MDYYVFMGIIPCVVFLIFFDFAFFRGRGEAERGGVGRYGGGPQVQEANC